MLSAKEIALILTYCSCILSIISLYNLASYTFVYSLIAILPLSFINDFIAKIYVNRTLLTIAGFALALPLLISIRIENIFEPISNLLILALIIKLLEEKKERDIYQIQLINLLSISLYTVFNLNITFLTVLLAYGILGVSSAIFLNISKHTGETPIDLKQIKRYLSTGVLLFIFTIIFSVPLFIILPRTPQPVFGFIQREEGEKIKTGISSEIVVGKVGEIQQDQSVVLRAYNLNLEGKTPYWRVQVFDTYEKGVWKTELKGSKPSVVRGGYPYYIILNPTQEKYIPLLDYPTGIEKIEGLKGKVKRLTGDYFQMDRNITSPIRIKAYYSENIRSEITWKEYVKLLEVPEDIPAYLRHVADKIRTESLNIEDRIRAVKEFFYDFEYTPKLPPYDGDPLEFFLKTSKKGNCEYFASATALLLRLLGIPARVVGGFKGAIKNPNGNYYIVKNSMAHVWVEAFVNNKWIRIDTTPPYTPPGTQEINKFELLRDAIIFFWYSNVVNFSTEHQKNILSSINPKNFKKEHAGYILPYIVFIFAFILILKIIRNKKNPYTKLYLKLLSKLESKFGPEIKNKTPIEVLAFLKGKEEYEDVKYIINIYLKGRFSKSNVNKDEIEKAFKHLKNI